MLNCQRVVGVEMWYTMVYRTWCSPQPACGIAIMKPYGMGSGMLFNGIFLLMAHLEICHGISPENRMGKHGNITHMRFPWCWYIKTYV